MNAAFPQPASPTAPNRHGLGIIFLTIFIDLIGFGIVIPLIPGYVRLLGSSVLTVGFVMASFTLMQFLFSPVWGRLSDRYGRKPFLLLGLLGSMASYLVFALAANLPMLLASRVLAGVFNANVAVGQAYIADITPPEQRARGMGLVGAAFGMGFTFGPALGGLAGWAGETWLGVRWGFMLPGFTAAGFSLFAFAWAWARLEESLPPDARRSAAAARRFRWKSLRAAAARPAAGVLLVLFFLEVFSFANYESSIILFADARWRFNTLQAGLMLGYTGILSAIVQGAFIGRLTRRFGEAALLRTGLLSLGIGMGLLPLCPHPASLLATIAPVALGIALVNPTVPALLSQSCAPEERGGLLGLSQSMGSLGRILGQPYGTTVFQWYGPAAPFYTAGLLMSAAALAALQLVRAGKPPQ